MRKKRPSAPMVLSIIAVVLSLAGTGAASVAAISALSKKEKKQTRKIANKQIKRLAPGLSVANAANAQIAANAQSATNATNAASAQPAAFAHVSAAGVLDEANSKNVGDVFRESEGVYCFSGIPFTPRGGSATVDGNLASTQVAQIGIAPCGAGEQAFVITLATVTDNFSDAAFYVVFYR